MKSLKYSGKLAKYKAKPKYFLMNAIVIYHSLKGNLNFNLNNVKNIKKGAIFPNDNVNQTVSSVAQYFNAPYDKVFAHLLGIVDNSELEVVSYDSESGRIFANYNHEKPVYITVSKYNSANVLVKVTPADGIYDIPATVTNKIFDELNRSITTK